MKFIFSIRIIFSATYNMHKYKNIRSVSRGIYIKEGKVLLAKSKGKCNYHLPGGGIERGESARNALIREIKEEINKDAIIIRFIGVIENHWEENDNSYFETNYLFIINFEDNHDFTSNEDKLIFQLIDIAKLAEVKILPEIMNSVLGVSNQDENSAFWFSNF